MSRTTYYQMPADKGEMASTLPEQFARRVRELMSNRGWNQSILARQASKHLAGGGEIDRQSISTYLLGRSLPQQPRLEAIAKALGVDPYELVQSPDVEWIGRRNAVGQEQKVVSLADRRKEKADPVMTMNLTGEGKVRLVIDLEVPSDIGVQIMGLLTGSIKP